MEDSLYLFLLIISFTLVVLEKLTTTKVNNCEICYQNHYSDQEFLSFLWNCGGPVPKVCKLSPNVPNHPFEWNGPLGYTYTSRKETNLEVYHIPLVPAGHQCVNHSMLC